MKTEPNDRVHAVYDINYDKSEMSITRFPSLTKREHFAALAMQGFLANPDWDSDITDSAILAVKSADALIAALNGEAKS